MIIKHKSKNTGTVYTVDTIKLSCTCPDYLYRQSKVGGLCKHIKIVLEKHSNNNEKALKFIEGNTSAVDFVEAFSEELLVQLKQAGYLIEKKNNLIILK